jgi:hypothetical protein
MDALSAAYIGIMASQRPDFFDLHPLDHAGISRIRHQWGSDRTRIKQVLSCLKWLDTALLRDVRTKHTAELVRQVKRATGEKVSEQALLVAACIIEFEPRRLSNGHWMIDEYGQRR